MFNIKTDILNIEFDGKLDEDSMKFILEIIDRIHPDNREVKAARNNISEEIQLLEKKPNNIKRNYDGIKEEEPVEVNIRELGLPNSFSSLYCNFCKQSFIMLVKSTRDILFWNYHNNKIYNLGPIRIPDLSSDSEEAYEKKIDIHNDCLEMCSSDKEVVLLSDSDDILVCPFCGEEITICDMYNIINKQDMDCCCLICGGKVEHIIKNNNGEAVPISKCIDNDCLSYIK